MRAEAGGKFLGGCGKGPRQHHDNRSGVIFHRVPPDEADGRSYSIWRGRLGLRLLERCDETVGAAADARAEDVETAVVVGAVDQDHVLENEAGADELPGDIAM